MSQRNLGSITLYTHFFTVHSNDPRVITSAQHAANNYAERVWEKIRTPRGDWVNRQVVSKIYATLFPSKVDFQFHKGQMPAFLEELKRYEVTLDDFTVETADVYTPSKVVYCLREGRVLRDYQNVALDFAMQPPTPGDHWSRLIAMATGTGKSVTSAGIAAATGTRWMVGVLPKYAQKWAGGIDKQTKAVVKGDVEANLDINAKDVMLIDSTAGLRGIIDHCKTHGTKKLQPVLVITLTCLRTFFEAYQEDPGGAEFDYGCKPHEMWKILDIGVFTIDEAHEHIYSVFLAALHMHGPKFVALSGTMMSEDPFQEKIQQLIFPMVKRFLDVKMAKYINAEFLEYFVHPDFRNKLKCTAIGRQDYSHVELEKSIMRVPKLLQGYLEMTGNMLDYGYMDRRVPGDKCVTYAATVDMVNHKVKYLRQRFPDLNINRYVGTEKDPYSNIIESDVSVTTIQSGGTALDIPGLITTICTTMINSGKSNVQVLGRLRDLPGKTMRILLPYCSHIQKHHKYMAYRYELFAPITKSIRKIRVGKMLGS